MAGLNNINNVPSKPISIENYEAKDKNGYKHTYTEYTVTHQNGDVTNVKVTDRQNEFLGLLADNINSSTQNDGVIDGKEKYKMDEEIYMYFAGNQCDFFGTYGTEVSTYKYAKQNKLSNDYKNLTTTFMNEYSDDGANITEEEALRMFETMCKVSVEKEFIEVKTYNINDVDKNTDTQATETQAETPAETPKKKGILDRFKKQK